MFNCLGFYLHGHIYWFVSLSHCLRMENTIDKAQTELLRVWFFQQFSSHLKIEKLWFSEFGMDQINSGHKIVIINRYNVIFKHLTYTRVRFFCSFAEGGFCAKMISTTFNWMSRFMLVFFLHFLYLHDNEQRRPKTSHMYSILWYIQTVCLNLCVWVCVWCGLNSFPMIYCFWLSFPFEIEWRWHDLWYIILKIHQIKNKIHIKRVKPNEKNKFTLNIVKMFLNKKKPFERH